MNQLSLIFNGIDAATGQYLLPPLTADQVSDLALGLDLETEEKLELAQRAHAGNRRHAGVEADARRLDQTGWGAIFPVDAGPELIAALQPLFDHRRQQAGERFKLFTGPFGVLPGETKTDWLARQGVGPGPSNPKKVPYYLLLVGAPQQIPFRFQYQLDIQYAVGRIHFDTLEAYASYAQSVVLAESGLVLLPRAVFFGAANPDDPPTHKSAERLVRPLAGQIGSQTSEWMQSEQPAPAWQVETALGPVATKARLAELLEGSQPPALLFTAMHGLGFPNGHALQVSTQGALLCQDWPGPLAWQTEISRDHFFSAEDLSLQSNLLGNISFFFACYAAGTPQLDEFAHRVWSGRPEKRQLAPQSFLAALPQKMLALPRGGALAVVGHVERAWSASFFWNEAGPQTTVFADCFQRLMKDGYPLGYALEVFNERYAELASLLSNELEEVRYFNKKRDNGLLASLWTAHNDARNYLIIGDPAVRLSVSGTQSPQVRPQVNLGTVEQAAAGVGPQEVQPGSSTQADDHIGEGFDASGELTDPVTVDHLQRVALELIQQLERFLDGPAQPHQLETLQAAIRALRALERLTSPGANQSIIKGNSLDSGGENAEVS